MADYWDDRMQEHFDKLQAALSVEFSNQLTTQLATIRAEFATQHTALKTELSAQHAATKTELAAQLEATGSQLEKRLEKGLEVRLGQRISVQAEELREIVRTAAENYGGVLGGLQREIAEFRDEWRKNTEVTDKALTNHLERIVVLEQVAGVSRE